MKRNFSRKKKQGKNKSRSTRRTDINENMNVFVLYIHACMVDREQLSDSQRVHTCMVFAREIN